MAASSGVKQHAAKDRAYDFVKDHVLRGEYAGGELISEGEVAAALNMSRTPIREAFLRLEMEGLLRLYPQRGALVVPVSSAEVHAVLEARLVVEQFAVEKAINGLVPVREALSGRLDEHVSRQREFAGAEDFGAFLEEDRLFHSSILAAADNALFTQFYASLRDRQVRMVAESLLGDTERRKTILDEHIEIADAVRNGDLERAQAAVRTHLASTRSALGLR